MIAEIMLSALVGIAPVQPITPPQPMTAAVEIMKEELKAKKIEEEGLERVFLSCYLPTGNRTADGTVPYEGICSCNREHLGMDCIMYDADLNEVARWECRDIGGNKLLRAGKAIDVYRDTMEHALALKKQYGDYVYIKWVDRE